VLALIVLAETGLLPGFPPGRFAPVLRRSWASDAGGRVVPGSLISAATVAFVAAVVGEKVDT
jgi:hypothetical protein